MLKRSQLRQFLAVVDAGSFTQAAARVRVTQPTLSVGIAEMEKTVGATLFIRDRKHVRLTEAGARLLPIARELEQGFKLAETLNAPSRRQWPDLRLGLLRTVAPALAQQAIQALGDDFQIELIEGLSHELRTALSTGRIDMALTLLRADDHGPHTHPLMSEPYVMLAQRGHPLSQESSVSPAALGGEIMIARRSCEILQDTSRFFTRNGVRPRFALRSDNDGLCLNMVAAGLAITTAPASMQSPEMSRINIEGYDFKRTLGLMASEQALASPEAAQRFTQIAQRLEPVFKLDF